MAWPAVLTLSVALLLPVLVLLSLGKRVPTGAVDSCGGGV